VKKPKAPKPTAQELAVTERQQRALDEEIAESEQRFKALARGLLLVLVVLRVPLDLLDDQC
jgi:hypothetical protein